VIDDRYQRGSTVLATQIPLDRWHEQIADPTYADSILDRLVHNAYRIELRGGSMRQRRELSTDDKSNTNKDFEQVIPDIHTIHKRATTTSKKD
jgi:IstB-like ATP binding protein